MRNCGKCHNCGNEVYVIFTGELAGPGVLGGQPNGVLSVNAPSGLCLMVGQQDRMGMTVQRYTRLELWETLDENP